MCLDDFGDGTSAGTKVDLWPCNGGSAQIWSLMSNGSLRINGLCLDAAGQGGDTTPLEVLDCTGQTNQQWNGPQSNGEIVGAQSSRCVDDPNFSTQPGTQLQLFDCNGGANQQWTWT
jgi:hypothetical protein